MMLSSTLPKEALSELHPAPEDIEDNLVSLRTDLHRVSAFIQRDTFDKVDTGCKGEFSQCSDYDEDNSNPRLGMLIALSCALATAFLIAIGVSIAYQDAAPTNIGAKK